MGRLRERVSTSNTPMRTGVTTANPDARVEKMELEKAK